MKIIGNLKVGKPDTDPSKPSHTQGTRMGNEAGAYEKEPGHLPDGKSTARRSTGINPEARDPIDPRMPNLSPG